MLTFLVLFFIVLDKVLLSSPGRPGAHKDVPAWASWALGLKGSLLCSFIELGENNLSMVA